MQIRNIPTLKDLDHRVEIDDLSDVLIFCNGTCFFPGGTFLY